MSKKIGLPQHLLLIFDCIDIEKLIQIGITAIKIRETIGG